MRLVLITLESGTVASAVSVATLAYYMSNPTSSNLIVIVGFPCMSFPGDLAHLLQIGRLYGTGILHEYALQPQHAWIWRANNERPVVSFSGSPSVTKRDHSK